MHRHPHFDIWLHDDRELAALLGSPLIERSTLHEWPLSCVQRIRTADGGTRIYKAQSEPTVEPAFYAGARSPLLAHAQIIDRAGMPAALLIEELTAPRLSDLQLTEAEVLGAGRDLLAEIAQITGDPPAVADIRTEVQWSAYADAILADLTALVESSAFRQVDQAIIDHLAQQMVSPPVLAAIHSQPGYVHQDLSGDNVFSLPDGYRVIDWQRPLWGPVALDLATLLESLGFEPGRHVESGVVQLMYLLRIGWFARSGRHFFPEGAEAYDATIMRLAAGVEQAGV